MAGGAAPGQRGPVRAAVVGDQIYGTGKTRAEVAQVSQGQTQLVALVPDYERRTDRFGPADFTLSADVFSLTCPKPISRS
ncbi:MAG: hypothetical protein BroJett011_54030 [Chloroflexota bacterium]|nr:MAG: hypothetical protein BroJett011_54030 [Chloroflexota bacterium]